MADPVRDVRVDDAEETQTTNLTVSSAKPHLKAVAAPQYHRDDDVRICGDFGGENASGAPCTIPAGYGTATMSEQTGRCWLHCDEKQDEIKEKKKKFIASFMNQPQTARGAAEAAGVSYMTVCRWRKQDAEFDREVAHILELAVQARAQFIEDSATLRAMDPTNNADTLRIFMLKNLMPHRYKDMYASEHSGPNGGPIPIVQHNVRWNIDGDSVRFFAETEPRPEPALPPARDVEQ